MTMQFVVTTNDVPDTYAISANSPYYITHFAVVFRFAIYHECILYLYSLYNKKSDVLIART